MEAQTISDMIRDAAGKTADDVMFGLVIDPEVGDRVQVTIIANNFVNEQEKSEPFINVDAKKPVTVVTPEEADVKRSELDLPPWIRSSKK